MISARKVVVSVMGAVLVSAPLMLCESVQPSVVTMPGAQPRAVIELGLQPRRGFDSLMEAVPVSPPPMGLPDLSRYRGFQFGETLQAVAKQAGVDLAEVKLIHARPAVIQELEWPIWLSGGSSPHTDAVRTVLFSFYNGELFRILVSYDRDETKGLTTEDMIDAISATYGTASQPTNLAVGFSSTQVYNDSETVLARWGNSQYSFNLFHSSYQPTFGMLAFSKTLDALARAATAEAIRLDAQEAPQREMERQNNEDKTNRELLEKARQLNKRNFHL